MSWFQYYNQYSSKESVEEPVDHGKECCLFVLCGVIWSTWSTVVVSFHYSKFCNIVGIQKWQLNEEGKDCRKTNIRIFTEAILQTIFICSETGNNLSTHQVLPHHFPVSAFLIISSALFKYLKLSSIDLQSRHNKSQVVNHPNCSSNLPPVFDQLQLACIVLMGWSLLPNSLRSFFRSIVLR